jgi:hypothetical protein
VGGYTCVQTLGGPRSASRQVIRTPLSIFQLVILHAKCTKLRLNDFNVYASRQVGVVFENGTCSITLGVFTAPGLAPPPTPPPRGPKKTYCDPQHKHSPVPQMCPLQGIPPTCGSIVVWLGLGCIVALYHRSPTLHQIR